MEFSLKYKLTLNTIVGSAEANIIQFNTKKRNTEKDRDGADQRVYKNDLDPVTIYPSGRYVDVFIVASSLNASMTYTVDIWIDNIEITKANVLKPTYYDNGTGIIDKRVTF